MVIDGLCGRAEGVKEGEEAEDEDLIVDEALKRIQKKVMTGTVKLDVQGRDRQAGRIPR